MKQLLIDCQILQTAAYDRGMGKYTQSLLKELGTSSVISEVTLVLNKNLDISHERISVITNLIPSASIVRLDLPVDISSDHQDKYNAAQKELTLFIETLNGDLKEVCFLILAPFFVDFAATFPEQLEVAKYLIAYDITPQKIRHLQQIFPDDIYYNHYQTLLKARHIFTISESVKADLIHLVGIEESRLTSIDGGPFEQQKTGRSKALLNLNSPYILYPTAPIIHKNNERGVSAFERFNKESDSKYTLYITSTFDSEAQKKLRALSPNIKFTGNITDAQLSEAYKGASAVFFTSLAEGLGMPVLEGALHGVPVACSDIPVLNELSKRAFYFFDPTDISSMSKSLTAAVKREDWKQKREAAHAVVKKYRWDRSAKILLDTISSLSEKIKIRTDPSTVLLRDRGSAVSTAHSLEIIAALLVPLGFRVYIDAKFRNKSSYLGYALPKLFEKPDITITAKQQRNLFMKSKKSVKISFSSRLETIHQYVNVRKKDIDRSLHISIWDWCDNSRDVSILLQNIAKIEAEL